MDPLLSQITSGIIECDPELTVDLVRQALARHIEPLVIIEQALVPGMKVVGDKFSCGDYFLPNLIIAAEGMQQSMQVLEPALRARREAVKVAGTVVIGTVHGDIHEIGKSLVATMLSVNGFQVHDLGVDVPVERFVSTVKDTQANLVCLSALLTTTMTVQRDTIAALAQAGLRQQVKVMVGGAPVTPGWAAEIGADGYAEDAIQAVEIARQLVG